MLDGQYKPGIGFKFMSWPTKSENFKYNSLKIEFTHPETASPCQLTFPTGYSGFLNTLRALKQRDFLFKNQRNESISQAQAENDIHGDILLGDFQDSFQNLSLKANQFFEFAEQNNFNDMFGIFIRLVDKRTHVTRGEAYVRVDLLRWKSVLKYLLWRFGRTVKPTCHDWTNCQPIGRGGVSHLENVQG